MENHGVRANHGSKLSFSPGGVLYCLPVASSPTILHSSQVSSLLTLRLPFQASEMADGCFLLGFALFLTDTLEATDTNQPMQTRREKYYRYLEPPSTEEKTVNYYDFGTFTNFNRYWRVCISKIRNASEHVQLHLVLD